MSDQVAKWLGIIASAIAVVGVIFTAGITYNQIQMLSKQVSSLETQTRTYEKVLNQLLGVNWESTLDEVVNVAVLEESLKNTDKTLHTRIDRNEVWVNSIQTWAKQQDTLVRKEALDKFRAIAVYSSSSSLDTFNIKINKQHDKGNLYDLGDLVLIETPTQPSLSVQVSVSGFTNDTDNPEVLVQMNDSLLKELNLSKWDGRYELFVTNDPQVLRWRSLEQIHLSNQ